VFGFDVMIVDCVWIVVVVRFCVVCVAAVCASVRFVLCASCVILAVFVPLVCFIAGLLWWTPFLCSCCRCIYKKEAWPPRVKTWMTACVGLFGKQIFLDNFGHLKKQ